MCMGRMGITTRVDEKGASHARRMTHPLRCAFFAEVESGRAAWGGPAPPAFEGHATPSVVRTLASPLSLSQILELVERRVRLARRERIRVERGEAVEHGGMLHG